MRVSDSKENKITKGQYDYQRKTIIEDLKKRIGPFDKLLFNGKTANQGLRINRKLSISATHDLTRYANKLTKLSRLATTGNVILAGAGVAMACKKIGDTDDRQEKNEILIETTTTTLVGVGVAVTLFLVSNPLGWAVAIGIGVGTAVGGYVAGKGVAKLYSSTSLKEHDLVEMTNVDQLCN